MSRSKALSLAPFASFIAMFAYLFILRAAGDPRAQDLKLEGNKMHWFEDVWLIATLVGVLFVWFRSVYRAAQIGKIGLAATIFFVWPVAAIYIWKYE
jgi:hypothetical protein